MIDEDVQRSHILGVLEFEFERYGGWAAGQYHDATASF
jgi:hypothetical protein